MNKSIYTALILSVLLTAAPLAAADLPQHIENITFFVK